MQVLVIGGTGHVGALAIDSLRRMSGIEALSGGRDAAANDVRIDLTDPATFGASDPFDVIVGCADSHVAPPHSIASHVARRGGVYVDTSADARTCLELLDTEGGKLGDGLVVVGAGAMPGLSNLLAADAVRRRAGATRVELVLSWSVLSEAGPGTVEIMTHGLAVPNRHYSAGRLVEGAPIGTISRVRIGGKRRWGFASGFPESAMLGRSLGLQETTTLLAVTPALPRLALATLRSAARAGLYRSGVVKGAMRAAMTLVRARILRGRTTALTMLATTDAASERFESARGVGLTARNAFGAAGAAIAAFAVVAGRGAHEKSGVVSVEELCSLDDLIRQMPDDDARSLARFDWSGSREVSA